MAIQRESNFRWVNFEDYRGNSTVYKQYVCYDGKRKLVRMNLTNIAVIESIVEQHAEEAAFLWLLRDAAVQAPHYSLNDQAGLDERVESGGRLGVKP